jgi:hypothetical protein
MLNCCRMNHPRLGATAATGAAAVAVAAEDGAATTAETAREARSATAAAGVDSAAATIGAAAVDTAAIRGAAGTSIPDTETTAAAARWTIILITGTMWAGGAGAATTITATT